jgi:adenylate cyclase
MSKALEPADVTRATRLAEADRNRRQVLAESALQGERAMNVFRLVLIAALGLSQGLAELGDKRADTMVRMVGVVLYAVFALGNWWGMRRTEAAPRGAFIYPFVIAPIDFAFISYMEWCDVQEFGSIAAVKGVAVRAVMLSFAAVRFAGIQVVYSVLLAIVSYWIPVLVTKTFVAHEVLFVTACFLVLGAVIGWAARRLHTMFAEIRRRDNLSRLLPRAIVDRILSRGEATLLPVQREVTVLFADIRDFTALSEQLAPREVLGLLDEHLGHMAQVVKEHDGMVNKFLGDGMLALWGAPDRRDDHAERAMQAALAMRAKIAELNAIRKKEGAALIRMGIGVHSGLVAAGMLGGADQHEYTVIGDAVNVASRVEGLTRKLDVDILVTERTWELGGKSFRGRRLGEEPVKGRTAPVVVRSLDGPAR